jgi:hypothetical protein
VVSCNERVLEFSAVNVFEEYAILSHAPFCSLVASWRRRWKLGYANSKRTDFCFSNFPFMNSKIELAHGGCVPGSS